MKEEGHQSKSRRRNRLSRKCSTTPATLITDSLKVYDPTIAQCDMGNVPRPPLTVSNVHTTELSDVSCKAEHNGSLMIADMISMYDNYDKQIIELHD